MLGYFRFFTTQRGVYTVKYQLAKVDSAGAFGLLILLVNRTGHQNCSSELGQKYLT